MRFFEMIEIYSLLLKLHISGFGIRLLGAVVTIPLLSVDTLSPIPGVPRLHMIYPFVFADEEERRRQAFF
jgi:hypothetical protein